ncbi:MAG TPA: hypothetical protein VGM90_14720 [Kofleriaceae bacterium]|jgi:hypothetical protein
MTAYRNDVDALANRHASLSSEVAQKTREVAESARALNDAKAKQRLPVLDNIKIATPCRADWNQMAGDERSRHCGECKKDVFNLSNMTRQEAEELIRAKNGDLCARYYQRHDGTILLQDCSVGIKQKRKRRVVAGAVAALLGGGAFLAYKLTHHERSEVVMGLVSPEYAQKQGGIEAARPDVVPPVIESRTVEIK